MPAKKANLPALPAQDEIEKALAPFVANLPAVVIEDDDSYVLAGDELRNVKAQQKRVDAMRKDALAPIKQLQQTVDGWFKPTLNRLELHESGLKRALIGYDTRKEAERRRLEAELRDQHAREQAQAEAEAAALAAAGKQEEAEAVLDLVPMMPTVVSSKPKLAGIGTREYWYAEVKDMTAFLIWCIDHDRLDMLQPNDTVLKAHATQTKGAVPIAGVRIWAEAGLAARA